MVKSDMRRVAEFVVTALLLLVLLAVLVSSVTNLVFTALRTWQAALLVMLSTVYAAHLAELRRARIHAIGRFYGTFYQAPSMPDVILWSASGTVSHRLYFV
jgi:hypothetical protein